MLVNLDNILILVKADLNPIFSSASKHYIECILSRALFLRWDTRLYGWVPNKLITAVLNIFITAGSKRNKQICAFDAVPEVAYSYMLMVIRRI